MKQTHLKAQWHVALASIPAHGLHRSSKCDEANKANKDSRTKAGHNQIHFKLKQALDAFCFYYNKTLYIKCECPK